MEFVVSLLDLLRLEGRAVRRGVASLWVELVLVAVAGALLLVGFVMIGVGVFLMLRNSLGTPPAAFLSGAMALLLAGGLLWVVRTSRR